MPIAGPFDRPIPGESLTGEPRNNPWEQPAQMSNVNEVAAYYIERLDNEEVLQDFGSIIQAGASLAPVVETVYMQGVMRGLHSIDAGVVVAPVIHAYIKASLEDMGIDVKDTNDNPQKKAENAEMQRFLMIANSMLDKEGTDTPDEGQQMVESMVETQEGEPVEEEMPQEEEIVQDSLKAAMDAADALGNDKLADQIGNTITFFTREYVVGRNSD